MGNQNKIIAFSVTRKNFAVDYVQKIELKFIEYIFFNVAQIKIYY